MKRIIQTITCCGMLMLTLGIAEAQKRKVVRPKPIAEPEQAASGTRLRFTDGSSIEVDEAWESEQGVWYRQRGISHLAARDRVKKIERAPTVSGPTEQVATVFDAETAQTEKQQGPVWIYLVGGARVEADGVTESTTGIWYRRGSLTMFLERSRVDRIEREDMESLAEADSSTKRARGWTTGSSRIDSLIKQNGARHGVDPYLIFCVMEQESHFNSRALSPKGARGLMQLMPGTAARFGVRNASDPAQNIAGGTRYLKELMRRFNGRIDLVLASYNAGEGAVAKFGNKVPPYRETRNYVKRISYRYRRAKPTGPAKATVPAPVTAGL